MENELLRELENGRVVRLLTKLGFINERPWYFILHNKLVALIWIRGGVKQVTVTY